MTSTGNDFETRIGLVLRKTLYSESSLILACLTREGGQLHVLLRGAAKPGKKSFPAADLFREIEIVYRPSPRTELQTARSVELLRPFDSIARRPAHFQAASWLARFALQNTVVDEPAPLVYEATLGAFQRLAAPEPAPVEAIRLGVCFVALGEHGLLPDTRGNDPIQQQIDRLRQFALDPSVVAPAYDPPAWQALHDWMMRYLRQVHLHVPDDRSTSSH